MNLATVKKKLLIFEIKVEKKISAVRADFKLESQAGSFK